MENRYNLRRIERKYSFQECGKKNKQKNGGKVGRMATKANRHVGQTVNIFR